MEPTQDQESVEEGIVETFLCENCQKEAVILREKMQEMVDEKKKQVAQLKEDIELKKEEMRDLVECRQSLSNTWGKVLLARAKVELTKRAYDIERRNLHQELNELQTLQRSNTRRDERLSRVRSKDFTKKEKSAQQEYSDTRKLAVTKMVDLQVVRRKLVTEVFRGVFPIEVEPLSEADAGEEDYQESVRIDCDSVMEVDDGWMLSGAHTHTLPNMHIVTASMPSDGNYSTYFKAVSERRKAHLEAAQQGVPVIEKPVHPCNNSYLSTPAGLVYTALFVDVIANTLDQPLPYPLSKRLAIGEYGNPNKRRRDFLNSVAKLDDDILYLCFAQNVPLTALSPGHTLQNLLALVTHTQLGRSGAFECHPQLMRYRGRNGMPAISPLSHDLDDSEPPNVSYAIDQSNLRRHEGYTESENDEFDSDTNEDDPGDYYYNEQEEMEEPDEVYDWEYLEPSIKELRLFEEEQMRAMLTGKASSDSTTAQRHLQVASEMEVQRDRLRRLDYDSTYLDYAAMSSTRNQSSMVARQSDSPSEGGSGVTESSSQASSNTDGSSGFFGTLSSLWTSAFGSS